LGGGEGAITEQYGWRQAKRRQSSQRIAVEHANAELRQWRPLQRWAGRRQDYAETHCAIAGLLSDRAAKRAARHRPSTELVPAFPHRLLNRPTHITPACPDPNRGGGRLERIVNAGFRWRAGPGIGRIGGMTSEPHRRAIGSLRAVALDAPDIDLLATFYEQLAGWRRVPDDDEDDWITIDSGDGWRIGLQLATDHVPPHWPDQDRPQQAHLDFRVPDIDAAAERAQQLGASLLRRNERWHTLADPAGHPFDLCVNPDDPRTTLMGVMLDCPDAKALSHFYAELLGKPVTYEADGAAMIGEDGAQPVMFQQVEQYTAPRWPDPAYPQQIHLDVTVQDVDAAERAALDIGATRLDGAGPNWRVYADPAGKPFCLVWTV